MVKPPTVKASYARSSRSKLKTILRRLRASYGQQRRRIFGAPLDMLIATILSQNTNDTNSSAAFDKLKAEFPTWQAVADAPVGRIARCIRACGLGRIKAARIRNALRRIRAETGRLSLAFLRRMPTDDARDYLLAFDGVGRKTASCVLLFACGKDVFPVDTHIRRIAVRLGVLDAGTSLDRAHELLAPLIDPKDRYAMHVLLITHGRRLCLARRPRCQRCCVLSECPYGTSACQRGCCATLRKPRHRLSRRPCQCRGRGAT